MNEQLAAPSAAKLWAKKCPREKIVGFFKIKWENGQISRVFTVQHHCFNFTNIRSDVQKVTVHGKYTGVSKIEGLVHENVSFYPTGTSKNFQETVKMLVFRKISIQRRL